jgi:hypothetical protein
MKLERGLRGGWTVDPVIESIGASHSWTASVMWDAIVSVQ